MEYNIYELQNCIKKLLVKIEYLKNKYSDLLYSDIPILFFGNIFTAKVITVGVNPSPKGCKDIMLKNNLDDVLFSLLNYFDYNPYMKWFGYWERALNKIGVSYNDATAAHIDMCPWATDSMRSLRDKGKLTDFGNLIKESIPYFWEIFELCRNVKLVLIAGASGIGNEYVNEAIEKYGNCEKYNLVRNRKNNTPPYLNENKIIINGKMIPTFFCTKSPSSPRDNQKEELVQAIDNNKEKLRKILM